MWFLSLLWFLVVYSGWNNSFCERFPILVWDDTGLYHWFYYHQIHWQCGPPIPVLLLLERQRYIYMKYWFLLWILLSGVPEMKFISESQMTASKVSMYLLILSIFLGQQNIRSWEDFSFFPQKMHEKDQSLEFTVFSDMQTTQKDFTFVCLSYSIYERNEGIIFNPSNSQFYAEWFWFYYFLLLCCIDSIFACVLIT